VGGVDLGRQPDRRPAAAVVFCFALALVVLGFWAYLFWFVFEVQTLRGVTLGVVFTAVYLFLGYNVHPRPDVTNLGLLGPLLDNPFRYSDDLNRFLVYLKLFLWPGRMVSESLVEMARLVAGRPQTAGGRAGAPSEAATAIRPANASAAALVASPRFWEVVDEAGGDPQRLRAALDGLSRSDLLHFQREWDAAGEHLVRRAAEAGRAPADPSLAGEVADWVIAQGRSYYATVYDCPEVFPPNVPDRAVSFYGLVNRVYQERFGEHP
jgi:hypothetical protein